MHFVKFILAIAGFLVVQSFCPIAGLIILGVVLWKLTEN